jgi:2-oxoglutarate dehydrogenase E2 component (dihydrolipoamide succinyltransferase)
MVKSTPDSSPYNSVIMPAKPKPTPVVKATPPAPAPLPVPAAMPMPNARPMPPPAAPVVPAATVPAADPAMSAGNEAVAHLLQTAKGNGPVEVRKASIQELAKLKLKTPEVMAALDNLSDDPTPAVRAEAIIASARLRMGR